MNQQVAFIETDQKLSFSRIRLSQQRFFICDFNLTNLIVTHEKSGWISNATLIDAFCGLSYQNVVEPQSRLMLERFNQFS